MLKFGGIWSRNLMPLMVYPKVLLHPNLSIKGLVSNSLHFMTLMAACLGSAFL